MDDNTRAQEYESLRQELLLLGERAHDVWRWGLVTMVAVFGAVVVTLVGVYDAPARASPGDRVSQFLADYGTPLALSFAGFFAGIAVTMSQLRARINEEMHRIGAYLAVFHEEAAGAVPDAARKLGWHIWNRLDKCVDRPSTKREQELEQRHFHGTSSVYLLVLVFIVGGTIAVVDAVAGVNRRMSVLGGTAVCIAVAAWLWRLDVKARRDGARWNRRWATLARLDKTRLNTELVRTGLRLDPSPSTPNESGATG